MTTSINSKMKVTIRLFFITSIICSIFCFQPEAVFADQNSDAKSKKFLLDILQISDDESIKANIFFADKAERQLYIFEPGGTIKESYVIDIGKNNGNKTKQDDKKTPEGIYLLEKKMTPPEIPFDLYGSLAITTNYPNVFDRFEKKTGHGIWLHSVPDTVALTRGSRGCVVVRNESIQKIADYAELNKSYLMINDKARWISSEEHEANKAKIIGWLEVWRQQWENQDLDNYLKNYSKDFSAPEFNFNSWKAHKQRLKSLYKDIKISFGSPHIFHQKNQYLIKFRQNYKSDQHGDEGIKTLFIIEEKGELKILREEWTELKKT
jgi:murein L,D-transpeptidase YafK